MRRNRPPDTDDPRLAREWMALGLLACLLAGLLLVSGATTRLDNVIYDAVLRSAPRTSPDDVLIVAIDDRALAEIGPWPWPRATHARIIDRLGQAGARAIAYDVLFVDLADPADDAALGRAIAASGRVCLPAGLDVPGPNGAHYALKPPPPVIASGAAGLGHVSLLFDADGVSRRSNLIETSRGGSIVHLARCAVDVGRGGRTAGPLPPLLGATDLERRDVVLTPFAGPPGTFRTVSAASVLRGELPDGFVRGRYVLVGATASGLHDRHSTPMSTRDDTMAGVEFQANLLQALLDNRVVRSAPWTLTLALGCAIIWGLLAGLRLLSPRWNLVAAAGWLAATLGVSAAALVVARVWIPPGSTLLALLVVFPAWGWRRLQAASDYLLEELRRVSVDSGPSPRAGPSLDHVGRRIAQLREAAARARELREAADQAAAHREQAVRFLSHDIRAPQSAILALVDEPSDQGPGYETMRRIESHARRTLALADNFAHLAKAEVGHLNLEPLDLADALDVSADEAWPLARKAGVTFHRDGMTEGLWVRGDRSMLARALSNLIDNAIKFSPPGGVIELTAEAAMLDGAPAARVSVRDHGPGIEPAAQARLFELYGQVGAARTGSIGLGLALVSEVLRQHGGTVTCESMPGAGATFSIVAPLEAAG